MKNVHNELKVYTTDVLTSQQLKVAPTMAAAWSISLAFSAASDIFSIFFSWFSFLIASSSLSVASSLALLSTVSPSTSAALTWASLA